MNLISVATRRRRGCDIHSVSTIQIHRVNQLPVRQVAVEIYVRNCKRSITEHHVIPIHPGLTRGCQGDWTGFDDELSVLQSDRVITGSKPVAPDLTTHLDNDIIIICARGSNRAPRPAIRARQSHPVNSLAIRQLKGSFCRRKALIGENKVSLTELESVSVEPAAIRGSKSYRPSLNLIVPIEILQDIIIGVERIISGDS